MGFVKEFRDFHKEMPEWQYLTDIGVRSIGGGEIWKNVKELVLDRENNYFLIPQGHTGFAYTDEDIGYFLLCLNGKKIRIEAVETRNNNADKTIDRIYDIRDIVILDDEIRDIYTQEDIHSLVKEAFSVMATIQESANRKNGKVKITGV
ncbi:MAG: hypothetical protein IK018_04505 [Lachnospiraceae bacterium]|nr:hypothetical protein [Lachnospiraceae bacterium]